MFHVKHFTHFIYVVLDVSRETLYNIHVSNEKCKKDKDKYDMLACKQFVLCTFL